MPPRAVLGILVAAFAFVLLSAALHPTLLGFGGILVFLVLLPLVLVGVRLGSDAPAAALSTSPGVLILLFTAGVAATAFYWYRVWTVRSYEMEGIPLVLFYFLAFWWPGFAIAVGSRFIEYPTGAVQLGPFALRVIIGIVAGATGALAYKTTDARYFATRDRDPLEGAVGAVEARGPGVLPGSFSWNRVDRVLRLRFGYDPTGRGSYESLLFLENYLWLAAPLTRRKDTDRIEMRVDAPGGELLVVESLAGDSNPWAGVRIDRRHLPGGGQLQPEDLERMSWTPSDQFLAPDHRDRFRTAFRATAEGDEVRIAFVAAGPPGPDDVDIHAAAWRLANTIVNETTRFFPDIERFAVELPGLAATVGRPTAERALAARPGSGPGPFSRGGLRLQSLLGSPDQVLALVVREGGRGEPGLDPSQFHATSPGLRPQIVIRRVRDPLESHLAAHLLEEALIETGRLYATALSPDGTVTLIIVPWEGPALGPLTLAAGSEATLGTERVANLGWRDRRLFRGEVVE